MPCLRTEFPVVTIKYDTADNDYPTLQWFSAASKRMIQRCKYKYQFNREKERGSLRFV